MRLTLIEPKPGPFASQVIGQLINARNLRRVAPLKVCGCTPTQHNLSAGNEKLPGILGRGRENNLRRKRTKRGFNLVLQC